MAVLAKTSKRQRSSGRAAECAGTASGDCHDRFCARCVHPESQHRGTVSVRARAECEVGLLRLGAPNQHAQLRLRD
eukprot:1194718-Pyramimonas_sp.AAC.1